MKDTMTDSQTAIKQHLAKPRPYFDACGCLGPLVRCGKLQPDCTCAMQMYEVVNEKYFRIEEIRGETGITMKATEIGPVGGPYTNRKTL